MSGRAAQRRRRRWRGSALGPLLAAGFLAALGAAFPRGSVAHELYPALLVLSERAPGVYDGSFRIPGPLARHPIFAVFPQGASKSETQRVRGPDGESVERFVLRIKGGLGGQRLSAQSPPELRVEVLIRIQPAAGTLITGRLVTPAGAFVVPEAPTRWGIAATYLRLGVEHILTGFDHLSFVLGLMLLVPSWRVLVATITAFTAAHSLTLAGASVGWIRLPSAPVEAVIALSIVFVAREAWRKAAGQTGLTARRPWLLAFLFGLLHGLGFAGALSEIGLPAGDVPLALLTFNAGVELGQLAFVAVAAAVFELVRRCLPRRPWMVVVPAYGIGTLAAFWCFERISGFF